MEAFAHPVYLKVAVMVALFLMSLGACALPFVVSKYVKNTVVLFSIMNCLSGGVVLGAALSHMMPDAVNNFDAYFADKNSPLKDYPITPCITAIGLILLLTIDRTLLAGVHSHSDVECVLHGSETHNTKNPTSHGGKNYRTYDTTPGIPSPTYTTNPSEPLLEETKIDVGFNTDALNRSISNYNTSKKKSVVAKAWVFLIALSVHSILEGLGMGAENKETAFFSVLFAILAHKSLEAFALGLSIFYANFKLLSTCLMIVGYSIATPLGVGVGIMASSLSSNQNLIAGILVSLASGSFLYISLIEILPTELHKPHCLGIKLGAMVFGWFCMVLLAYFA